MRKIIHSTLLVAFLAFAFTAGKAQQKTLKFKNLTREDGLSSTIITGIAQTPDGYIWLGTADGLNRFDGDHFTVFRNEPGNANSIADNNITTLYVDKKGSLWIGTQANGLSRYISELESFRNYKSVLHEPRTLSSYYVTDIAEDANGVLWIATAMGLNQYHPQSDSFNRFFHRFTITINTTTIDHFKNMKVNLRVMEKIATMKGKTFADENQLTNELLDDMGEEEMLWYKKHILKSALLQIDADKIRTIEPDADGNLWIGYEDHGLAMFNPASKVLNLYSPSGTNDFWEKQIQSLYQEHDNLWIGTRDGHLACYHIRERKLELIPLDDEAYNIESMLRDSRGRMWLGDDYGLCNIEGKANAVYRYQNDEHDKFSLVTSSVKVIFEDHNKNLWIGCSGGVSMAIADIPFQQMKHNIANQGGLSKNNVSAVLEDSRGNVWIGYYTMGIDRWNRVDNTITRISYMADKPYGLGKGTVFDIHEDRRGVIWVGTYEGGLQYYDEKIKGFRTFVHDPGDSLSISGNDVRAISEDSKGNLWLAIHGHGINRFSPETHQAKRFYADYDNCKNSLANDWVYTVYVDRHDNVWAGTVFGVSVLYDDADHFVTFNHQNSGLSHDHVRTICEDNKGGIWLGTHNGLNQFNGTAKTFSYYDLSTGLPNNMIQGVLSDRHNNIWISTNNGLSRLHPEGNSIRNFTTMEGLQGAEFFPAACHRGTSGIMYFGGTEGLNFFNPDSIVINRTAVPVVLSSLTLFNKTINAGSDFLERALNHTDAIELKSNQNVFSISYAGLSYPDVERIQYAYKLEGFDDDWNYVGNKREATYTNLDPGSYTFKVKAANSSGIWNQREKSIRITVLPPFWKTPWAYATYLIIFAGFLYFYRRTNIAREQFRNQLRLKELEVQKARELDTLKQKFFTNISHEFKTPLTLISGPVESLISDHAVIAESKKQAYYKLIHKNANHLMRLINQLLDLSALDSGFMKLQVSRNNIVRFASNITDTFAHLAEHSEIRLSFSSNVPEASVYFDPDKVEKILYNLISNAIKFTERNGSVTVALHVFSPGEVAMPEVFGQKATPGGEFVHIVVSDSGVGIRDRDREKIFERFYQCTHEKQGTGIGLALTRQLVDRHQGIITVESEPGKGSIFSVWLPVSENQFAPDQIVQSVSPSQSWDRVRLPESADMSSTADRMHHDKADAPVILLVEDNGDVRSFLRVNLSDQYNIHEAAGGNEGLVKALDLNPDLIISDIVMSEGDGYTLCKNIKSDHRTSHIPVLLLTARTSDHFQLEGFQYGAEDYIIKPFNPSILKARIQSLLQARQKLKDKFYADLSFDPVNIAANVLDKSFVSQLLANIESNLKNEDFNPDLLATNLNISRSQLYKKVKGLTGLSVSIFVRNIRLRKAAQLLKANALPVSQAAYEVGFSDPGYFTKCFRELYGKSPSEFIKHPVDV